MRYVKIVKWVKMGSTLFSMTKKKIIILSGFLALSLLFGLVVFFSLRQKEREITPSETKQAEQETLVKKQLKELEELRNKAGIAPLTEEQMLAQQKELEALRKKAGLKPLSQEQVQKQLDELAALKDGEPRPDESGRENLRQANE